MDCADISGIALWQLMDIKVDAANTSINRLGGINNLLTYLLTYLLILTYLLKVDAANTSMNRPGGINNKGVLDRWRRPKPAAATVAGVFAAHP